MENQEIKSNENNTAKVICSNCEAEITTPNHEHAVSGVAIDKDSGIGTVTLPTQPNNSIENNLKIIQKLTKLVDKNTDKLRHLLKLLDKVDNDGCLEVNGIIRRWIPAQCLAMLYSGDGFHRTLTSRWNALDYSWKVLIDDLTKQRRMYQSGDIEGYKDRNRWYNRSIAFDMATDFSYGIRERLPSLAVLYCKGRPYVKISCWLNDGKGVFVDELDEFMDTLKRYALAIMRAENPLDLENAVKRFNQKRSEIRIYGKELSVSGEFVNAYKAAGGYYTAKDLIMFEGCLMEACENTEQSLEALEQEADRIVQDGVYNNGYKMLGVLRELLSHNNFDYQATKNKWIEQSEKRRAGRASQRNQRRSRI